MKNQKKQENSSGAPVLTKSFRRPYCCFNRKALFAVFIFVIMPILALHAAEKMDLASEEFYRYARYLFTSEESRIFKSLPDKEAREEFIRYFWEIRDPNPFTPENEFKSEMQERMDFVEKYLREGPVPGWKTDRGRIFILLGAPNEIGDYHDSEKATANNIIIWFYETRDIFAFFVDSEGHGVFRLDLTRTSMRLLDELEVRKYYITNKDDGKFGAELLDIDLKYDEAQKKLTAKLPASKVQFQDSDNAMMKAQLKMEILIYAEKKDLIRRSELLSAQMSQEDLLKKDSILAFVMPLELPAGKNTLDIIISDFLGDAVIRKVIKVKIKK